jgi:LL-diaminopimelate aminotransferase
MRIEMARRIDQIPPYLFAEIDKKKVEMRQRGVDLIDLGIGDPDLPTPKPIIERLKKAAENPKNHRYPSYEGMIEFRTAVAQWYERRFGIKLNPGTEVLSLIGSKEGIAHIPLAFVNPGDVVLVPSPGYPVYRVSTRFAGGTPFFLPLRKENGFLPNLSEIPETVAQKAKILFILGVIKYLLYSSAFFSALIKATASAVIPIFSLPFILGVCAFVLYVLSLGYIIHFLGYRCLYLVLY